LTLFKEERHRHFSGLAGTLASLRLPIPDQWINRLIADRKPDTWPIRELSIEALAKNELIVRAKPKAALMPQVQVRVFIERQPEFPDSPVLVLRLSTNALTAVALSAIRSSLRLPPGVRLSDDRLSIDVEVLAKHYGYEEWLGLIRRLEISTTPGRVEIDAEAGIRPSARR